MNRHQRRAQAASQGAKLNGAAHKMVAELAAKMALTVYAERCRRDPGLDRSDKAARLWASRAWVLFRLEARATLAKMLESNMAEDLKNQIFQALLLDASIPAKAVQNVQMKLDF